MPRKGRRVQRQATSAEELGSSQPSSEESPDADNDSLRGPGMFDGLTAWFSTSVSQTRRDKWSDADGEVADADTALYVFSQVAEAEDTKELFKSEAYLHQHLALIHPAFIDECVAAGSVKAVPLGKYFLPPIELHRVIQRHSKFPWEAEAASTSAKSPVKGTSQSVAGSTSNGISSVAVDGVPSPSSSSSQRPSASSSASQRPSASSSASQRPSASSSVQLQQPASTEPGNSSSSSTMAHSPQRIPARHPEAAGYFSLDPSDYIPVEDMPAVSGEICDFTAGQNGCRVYKST